MFFTLQKNFLKLTLEEEVVVVAEEEEVLNTWQVWADGEDDCRIFARPLPACERRPKG